MKSNGGGFLTLSDTTANGFSEWRRRGLLPPPPQSAARFFNFVFNSFSFFTLPFLSQMPPILSSALSPPPPSGSLSLYFRVYIFMRLYWFWTSFSFSFFFFFLGDAAFWFNEIYCWISRWFRFKLNYCIISSFLCYHFSTWMSIQHWLWNNFFRIRCLCNHYSCIAGPHP